MFDVTLGRAARADRCERLREDLTGRIEDDGAARVTALVEAEKESALQGSAPSTGTVPKKRDGGTPARAGDGSVPRGVGQSRLASSVISTAESARDTGQFFLAPSASSRNFARSSPETFARVIRSIRVMASPAVSIRRCTLARV